jgi:thioredoxin-related protein
MKMKKIILLLTVFSVWLFALEFTTDYKSALEQAAKQKKPLLVLITQNNCNWCDKLKNKTLEDKKVAAVLKKSYVVVVLNKDTQELPQAVKVRVAPTTFILNAKEEKQGRPMIGYFDADIFLDFVEDGAK